MTLFKVLAIAKSSFILNNDGSLLTCGKTDYNGLICFEPAVYRHFNKVEQTPPGFNAVEISSKWNHALVLGDDDTVWGCGENSDGELGLATRSPAYTFVKVPLSFRDFRPVAVQAGDGHSMILGTNNQLLAVGGNAVGQLGLGHNQNKQTFGLVEKLPPELSIIEIELGVTRSLLLSLDGSIWGCGNNSCGQLGCGKDLSWQNTFMKVSPVGFQAISVATGGLHTIVLCADGSVWVCGDNTYGQLGLGDKVKRQYGFKQILSSNVLPAVAIAAGDQHSFVLCADGSVLACGRNSEGQLGLGNIDSQYEFVKVRTLPREFDVIAISTGYRHTLIIGADGCVFGAGYNGHFQLGLQRPAIVNSFTQLLLPTPKSAPSLLSITSAKVRQNSKPYLPKAYEKMKLIIGGELADSLFLPHLTGCDTCGNYRACNRANVCTYCNVGVKETKPKSLRGR